MIGTSGADALSRAAGDERLLRAQRSDNKADRDGRQKRKKNKRSDKKFEDVVEMSADTEGVTEIATENEPPSDSQATTAEKKDRNGPPPDENAPHIDVTG
ncbi:MAG: hypothetical protein ACE5GA_10130 [Candidatus Zixiibacteriota bacterium]